MNDEERLRRKKIWESLTDDERKAAEQKKADIISWSIQSEKKAVDKIKAEGRYLGGLDGNYPELKEVSKEAARRMNELLNSVFKSTTSQ